MGVSVYSVEAVALGKILGEEAPGRDDDDQSQESHGSPTC
jgi:hypothetical protein